MGLVPVSGPRGPASRHRPASTSVSVEAGVVISGVEVASVEVTFRVGIAGVGVRCRVEVASVEVAGVEGARVRAEGEGGVEAEGAAAGRRADVARAGDPGVVDGGAVGLAARAGGGREAVALVELRGERGHAEAPEVGGLAVGLGGAGGGAEAGVAGAVGGGVERAQAVGGAAAVDRVQRVAAEDAGLGADGHPGLEAHAQARARAGGLAGIAGGAGGGAGAGRVGADGAAGIAVAAVALRVLAAGGEADVDGGRGLAAPHVGAAAALGAERGEQPVDGGDAGAERAGEGAAAGQARVGAVTDAVVVHAVDVGGARLGAEAARRAASEDRVGVGREDAGEVAAAVGVGGAGGREVAGVGAAPAHA